MKYNCKNANDSLLLTFTEIFKECQLVKLTQYAAFLKLPVRKWLKSDKVSGENISNFKRVFLENEDLSTPVRPLIGKRKQKYTDSEKFGQGFPSEEEHIH